MSLSSNSPAYEKYKSAEKAFKEGNYQETLRILTFAFEEDHSYRPLYELSVKCLKFLGGRDESVLFEKALSSFNKFEPFYNLGYHFIDVGHTRLAIPFLQRATELSPDNLDSAFELSIALTAQFQPQKARAVLDKVDIGDNFWAWYQFYWCSLLSNKPEGIKEFIYTGKPELKRLVESGETDFQPCLDMILKLEECYKRLNTVPTPQPIIRDWHFIQYGSAILDYFDSRTADDGMNVAGGRYVVSWGTNADISGIISKLNQLLTKLDRQPETVLALPDRDSEIIGRAAAKILVTNFETLTQENAASGKCLIVAGNSTAFNEFPFIAEIKQGQTVFALNHNWLLNTSITPDIIGVMTQLYNFPWQGGMKANPKTNQMEETQPDERPAEEIASNIAKEQPNTDPSFAETLSFYLERKEYLKGGTKAGTKRLMFSTDSPVPGSYFC
ncbi:MAG: tetratricopeptide repeat protein [Clostridia bacterium]|nr:tetratricopeptide repeat protein [Clostridia bacterium]